MARQHGAERIVVGLPLSMNGDVGQQAEKVLAFSVYLPNVVISPWITGMSGFLP